MALRCSRVLFAFPRTYRNACGVLNSRFLTLRSSVIHFPMIHPRKVILQYPNIFTRCLSSLPKHTIIKLPNLSPTMETGTVVSWAKNVGDEVSEGDLLAEIETDKATMSFDASEAGYLAKILAPSGTKDIPVGSVLCILVEDPSSIPAFADYVPTAVSAPTKTEPKPSVPPQQPAAPSPPPPSQSIPTSVTPTTTPKRQPQGQRVFASPLARRLAAEQGINLSQLTGTGVGGMIRSADLSGAKGGFVAAASSMGGFSDIPISDIRAAVANRLLESKRTVPHYYLTTDIQIDGLLDIRRTINNTLAKSSDAKSDQPVLKITLNDILIKAAALVCLKVPECNSAWNGDVIRQFNTVDVNFAVTTSAGLITPVIYSVETKGLMQISNEVRTLVAKAKANQLQSDELRDGTFTISNLGMFGISCFSATIIPPQACTLAVGSPLPRLIPDERSISGFKQANSMSVTLSCDHRVVDGAVGATWLAEFKKTLENPALLLM